MWSCSLLIIGLALGSSCTSQEAPSDRADGRKPALEAHEDWFRRADGLLKVVVRDQGLVDYRLAARLRAAVDALVREAGPKQQFENRAAKLAWHINAYNLVVIQQVLEHLPLKSVRDVTGFFDERRHRVNGLSVTLNEFEGKHIRTLNDPRCHAALVCGAVSCPPLRRGAFVPDRLEKQLETITRRWINDPQKNRAENGVLKVSAIFKWYADDFQPPPYKGVAGFLRRHATADSSMGRLLGESADPPTAQLPYDWALNKVERKDDDD